MGLQESLSERELEILTLLAAGYTNREIAQRLHLTYNTVKWYNTQLYGKLGVSNRDQAINQAHQLGLFATPTSEQASSTPRHNLPHQTTPFIGREQELADLSLLMADLATRLITILAPGGMGKTRLALAAAEQLLPNFPDGVFFVPLAPLSSANDIVTTIAENVGFSFYGTDSPSEQLLDYFRERHVLLVLDNFEHLLDGAPLVTDILQVAPQVKVLTTSREKLNLSGETIYSLSGLDFPTWETPEDALAYDAVKLFMQSAQRARPTFELLTQDLNFLARICRLTEGLPLGLELAAGWVDVLSLEQIATELQQGIDILETEMRDIPERHRSIRATFESTWQRLTGGERAVFSRLSVFRGGFTLAAAQNIAGANAIMFRRLAQKALIQTAENERFNIHELLRQFAASKLEASSETENVQQAHSTYYMHFMAERDSDIKGHRQQAGLREIRADFENIRQAWLWAVDHQQYDAISRALDCLTNYAERTFSLQEVLTLLQRTVSSLQPATGELPSLVWDQATIRYEHINWLIGAKIDSDLIESILPRMRSREAYPDVAHCLNVLGHAAERNSNAVKSQEYREECLALWHIVGDTYYIAPATLEMFHVYKRRGQIERGLDCVRECVRIHRRLGVGNNLCASLSVLGWMLTFVGEFTEAEALQDEALAMQDQIGKVPYYVFVVGQKANLAFWRGDFETAVQWIHEGQDFADGRDYLGVQPSYFAMLSWIVSVKGDYQGGYDLVEPALTNLLPNTIMYILAALALAQLGLGDYPAAWQALRGSLTSARDYTRGPTQQQICLPLAAVLEAQTGDIHRAVQLIGLTQAAPRELMGWLAKWQLYQTTCAQLENQLGMAVYAKLIATGANLNLDAVVVDLLAESADTQTEQK